MASTWVAIDARACSVKPAGSFSRAACQSSKATSTGR